jgi:hypothetical protein
LEATLEEGMRNLKKGMTTALILAVLVTPSWGDVIGSRTRTGPDSDRKQVAGRLHQLGIHPSEACLQVDSLSARDLAFFAENPRRVLLAGAQDEGAEFFSGSSTAMWYEIVGGSGFLLLSVIVIWYALIGQD